jgi:predicted RNA binding protein YcfA (HicA-like mRNA interferase family)
VSPAPPLISGAQAIAALAKVDFVEVSQRGSHVKLRRQDGTTVIVPAIVNSLEEHCARSCAKPDSASRSSFGSCEAVAHHLGNRRHL